MPKLNLQRREKQMVIVGALVFAVVLLYWIVQPAVERYHNVSRKVEAARRNIDMVRSEREAILTERESGAKIREWVNQQNARDLMVLANQHASDMGLLQDGRAKLQSVPLRGEREQLFQQLRVTLTGVSTTEFVEFMHRLYSAQNIIVTDTAEVKPNEAGKGLNCTLLLLAPKP